MLSDVFSYPLSPLQVPEGVMSENERGRPWVEQRARPRRNRKNASIRKMVQETVLRPSNFIYPLFIHNEKENVVIESMPGASGKKMPALLQLQYVC